MQTRAESRAKVRTADLLPLCLSRARVVRAGRQGDSEVPAEAVLLFPGDGALPLESFADATCVVLIDGTWDAAGRVLERSSVLRGLKRAFVDERFLGSVLFRVRKPPSDVGGARSTAEAAAGAIACLEGERSILAVQAVRRAVLESSEIQLRFVREKGLDGAVHRRSKKGYIEGLYDPLSPRKEPEFAHEEQPKENPEVEL